MGNDGKTTSITLKNIPENLHRFLLDKQADIKVDKGVGFYSLEKTVYKLLDDHLKLTGYTPKPARV